MAVNTRLAMGLPTRANTPPAYSHGNSLVENAIGRIRPLAGSLMHALGQKVGMEFSTSNPLWTWALRHSCWLMNRFNANKGVTSFELITNKPYRGGICQFGEPVYGYSKSNNKGSARWSRMIFLGKVDPQDSFILYNGVNLVLVKSIRRIQTDWRGHLAFYVNFKCSSFDYKSGFGGRVVPTKANRSAVGASFNQPQGAIEPSAFYDEDGAAVIEKAKEEKREELESTKMALWDRPEKVEEELIELPPTGTYPNPTDIWGEGEDEPIQVTGGPSTGHADVPPAVAANDDDVVGVPNPSLRLDAPSTPIDLLAAPSTPPSPRATPTTRVHDAEVEEEHSPKRFKEEPHKKARLTRLSEERDAMVRVVKIADDEFYTMDSYNEDPQLDDHCDYGDPWMDEDKVTASGMPEALWYDGDITVQPPTPANWIDQLADKIEIQRLCNMGVLMPEAEYGAKVESRLTTRFVYDWRLKDYSGPNNNEPTRKRWLRRSRCVAREYAFLEHREDTFAPASSTHVLNILPVLWLQKAADFEASKGTDSGCEWLLATLDVKDAFLMVPQPEVLKIRVGSENYIVLRNLPGQRQGARSWYWHLRKWLDDSFNVEWCLEQPCLCRGNNFCLLTHVDDILYCGSRQFWNDVFLPTFKKSFTVSYSMLEGVGSEISFLKRKIQRLENGLALIPGTNIHALVTKFEEKYGRVRCHTVPGDNSLQREDVSAELSSSDGSFYRMCVGVCLYLSRDRPDIVFPVKELASKMSRPTINSLQCLKRLIGYLKVSRDYMVVLEQPIGGSGQVKQSAEHHWILESFSDSDWSTNQEHRRSTSAGCHLLCGCYMYSSSRTQRVISLSSCEVELHGMVSTLADGIFLKRCIEFLVKATVEHYLLTDSSSARQLAQRQGIGKIKHLSAKVLWIQQQVQDKMVSLCQISTVWNVSDVGTKVLSARRLKLLLHQLGMFTQDSQRVGEEEFNEANNRAGGRNVMQLARVVARVIAVMGLEPTRAMGQGDETCSSPSLSANEWWFKLGIAILVVILIAFAVGCFVVRRYVKQLLHDLYHLSVQVAEADTVIGEHMQQVPAIQSRLDGLMLQVGDVSQRVAMLSNQVIETQNQLEMVSDRQDGLHFAIIEIGGFVRYHDLTARERSSMFTQERGNMMALNTMGASQYLRAIRAQSRAFVRGGEDTDPPTMEESQQHEMEVDENENENGESENRTDDEIITREFNPERNMETRRGELTATLDDLRRQLDEALVGGHYSDGAEIQQTILMVLDHLNNGDLRLPDQRRVMYLQCADRMQQLSNRVRRRGNIALADVYLEYAASYRNSV